MLELGRVCVGGDVCRLAGRQLCAGDVVELRSASAVPKSVHKIRIVHEDKDLIVVIKPTGLLTIATAHEKEKTTVAYLRDYLRASAPSMKLYIVHRLDKFASGLLVLAKSEAVKLRLRALFEKHDIQRKYWAIVEGRVDRNEGTIRSRLVEGPMGRMRSTRDPKSGKLAVTHFRVLRRFSNLTALEVTLETGRKNQIRAHLSEMSHPIVGDRAYGSSIDPMGRLGLHAFLLGFRHPTRGNAVLFQTEPPPEFRRYLPRKRV